MICAESTAIDHDSNLVSVFNVAERYGGKVPADAKKVRVKFHALAVWRRDEATSAHEKYEFEFYLRYLDGTETRSPQSAGEFDWKRDNALMRLRLLFAGDIDIDQTGYVHVVARIRRAGEDTWIAQSYPILLEFERAEVKADG